ALRFAESRGLNIVQVARTLLRDQLDWTLRQKTRLVDLGQRLAVFAERLGLHHPPKTQTMKEAASMVAGMKTFSGSVADTVEHKLDTDPALRQQWEEVSTRFAYVFADPETAFRAMNFDAVLADKETAKLALQTLTSAPASIGPLKGKTGILASKADRQDRRVADLNVPALKRDLEQYLRMRETAVQRLQADEQAQRQRVSIDIPALSQAAHVVLERVRDAIDRNDLPAAMAYALSNRETKLEIDGFNQAVTERFGERTMLTNAAREPSGKLFDKLSEGMQPEQKERLMEAWPIMRTSQQLAAHERTVQTLRQAEDLRLAPRQTPVMKQ
ncbi:Dtr system oriT relaxase, partial [Agrobacterium vitis]|uniref:BID domain-containing protein n=1 Tax=Agrobacterium vitis TaxID=373 RepID=UPI00132B55FC